VSDVLQLFLIGVVSSYGACLISCWPVALPFVTAMNEGWRRRLQWALVFLFAKLVVYGIVGFAAAVFGRGLMGWLRVYGAALFVVVGTVIFLLGVRAALTGAHPCQKLLGYFQPSKSLASPALMGVFLGLLPCPTSLAVTAYIALTADSPLLGAVLGLAFGAGKFFSPLLPTTVLFSYFEGRMRVNRVWMRFISGVLVAMMGLRLILSICI